MIEADMWPRLTEIFDADDAADSDAYAAFVAEHEVPVVQRLLADAAPGSSRSVLAFDGPHPLVLALLADWAGSAGKVDVVRGPQDDEDSDVTACVAELGRDRVQVIDRSEARPGDYGLVFASRVLYWEPENVEGRHALIDWMRSLMAPAGHLMACEMDFRTWNYLPATPAITEVHDRVEETFGYDFTAAGHLPGLFRRVGLEPTLHAFSAVLPANSFLGRKTVGRARAFLEVGAWDSAATELVDQAERDILSPDRWVTFPAAVHACATAPTG
ncbi:hypothetical protein [Pseudonocardia sp. TRM90224]|uniref:hypothetical protein n=1 Tax=Pseudonocardia sp. TRM90224 TaxID=2812678 RepID=UPI001E2C7770|nr:hypothetical protein [Pseudonocardia sp. TRM90224]